MKKPQRSVVAVVCMLLVCVIITGCAASGDAIQTDPAAENSWEVSEEVKQKLKQEYVESWSYTDHTCTAEDVSLVVISHVDAGYALVIGCKCSSVDLNVSWNDLMGYDAGRLMFYMPEGWLLKFYKDGEFCQLDVAYNLGWLNYEQLRAIWDDYHAQFPKALEVWQRVNDGLLEPPPVNASGLDYAVNDDGVTCTVTGLGVCNDRDVVIPEYIDGYRVTAIGNRAFLNGIGVFVTSVTMPDSVVRIEREAFVGCRQLKSIKLSASLEIIGLHAFADCEALAAIQLPDSLLLIDGGAFSGCNSLTEITVPKHVTVIGPGAFSYCRNLKTINLHDGITEIGEGVINGCASSVVIKFQGTMAQWKAISRMNPWYDFKTECVIHCSDGEIVDQI